WPPEPPLSRLYPYTTLFRSVVDENGEPKVVYHGTLAAFEEFDERLADPGALFGPGFYFTEDAAIASTYTTKYHPAVRRWSDEERSEEHTSELQSRENLVCGL